MAKDQSKKTAFIYNPHAGTKRKILPNPNATSLEEIKQLLDKYQISVEYFPTKYPEHATELAQTLAKKGYKRVIVAGGDGTVGETANGLVNSDVELGILPLGSFMNIARMLSIPLDIEKAVMLLKIGHSRKIDVGCITKLGDEKLKKTSYFLESCGLGLEAQLQQNLLDLEKGSMRAIINLLKTLFDYYGHAAHVILDSKDFTTRALLLNTSNGPYSGAAIPMAPKAKLNDHLLTITQFKLSKAELLLYMWRLTRGGKRGFYSRIVTDQSKYVKIETKIPRPVHADARLYGITPVEIKIIPNALKVITGFPSSPKDDALITKTYLE